MREGGKSGGREGTMKYGGIEERIGETVVSFPGAARIVEGSRERGGTIVTVRLEGGRRLG